MSLLSSLNHLFSRSKSQISLNLLVCKLFKASNNTCSKNLLPVVFVFFFFKGLLCLLRCGRLELLSTRWHARHCLSAILFYLLYFLTILNISFDLFTIPQKLRWWFPRAVHKVLLPVKLYQFRTHESLCLIKTAFHHVHYLHLSVLHFLSSAIYISYLR